MVARMVDLDPGTVIRLRPELLRGEAVGDLASVESVIVVSHGTGSTRHGVDANMRWSIVERPDGTRVDVLDGDIEPAIVKSLTFPTYYVPDAVAVSLTPIERGEKDPAWHLWYILKDGSPIWRVLYLDADLDNIVDRKDSAQVTSQVRKRLSKRYTLTDRAPSGRSIAEWTLTPRDAQ